MSTLILLTLLAVVPEPPKGYVCSRASRPIVIDGQLDDADWAEAPWTTDFVDIEGDKKPRPRYRTRAKMLWDDEYFYIAAQLDEPHVWATLTKHDSVIFHDPDFEVFIDPDGDNHEYYEFEINALNTGWDLRLPKPYKDGGSAVDAWEIPGLRTAVSIVGTINNPSDIDKGWSVEIAIPWKVLGEFTKVASPPREGDQWRVNFSRVEWLFTVEDGKYQKIPGIKEDNWVWSPQGVIDMHRPETWGYVQFSRSKALDAKYVPDGAWVAKAWLHKAYYSQRERQNKELAPATTVEALGIALDEGLSEPMVRGTEKGYEIEVTVTPKDSPSQRWRIGSDSLLTKVR